MRLLRRSSVLLLWIGLGLALQADAEEAFDSHAVLTSRGFQVTRGATVGYVDDRVCGMCHVDVATSYREVAMSRSFYRPSARTAIEAFDREYFHQPSQRYYRLSLRGDDYWFRRYQLDPQGQPINVYEQQIDWVLGSGNHSRIYLYRTEVGEVYQLPISWYSQAGEWGMAPGFDRPDHEGVLRLVRRECMFCHNAYPDVPAGADAYREPHLFPAELPQGIGCQRCHGPGAEHLALALTSGHSRDAVRKSIVQFGQLEPHLRDSVCYGCHMQPSVTLSGIRRFGRDDFSFRPGEALEDYLVQVDIVEASRERSERFEINHHPYRMEQSPCFIESEGALSCLSCHDPHRKVQVENQAAHYRAVCLGCHEPSTFVDKTIGKSDLDHGWRGQNGEGLDCVSCHMPERRPQDVVLVTMTDHRIQIPQPGVDWTAPLEEEHEPEVLDVHFLDPDRAPKGFDAELYRAATVARIGGGSRAATEQLARLLASEEGSASRREAAPWFDLAAALLKQRKFDSLSQAVDVLETLAPDSPLVPLWRGTASFLGDRDLTAAVIAGRQAISRAPERAEAHYNLGLFVLSASPAEAARTLSTAVQLRPNLYRAWYQLGRAQRQLGQLDEAASSFKRTLEIEPNFVRAYLELAEVLAAKGQPEERRRYLEHALRVAVDPGPIREIVAVEPR